MELTKIRIGGVTEHFNLPIHLANEQGRFRAKGLEIEWTDFTGGTGQMNSALRADEVDVCILLTEGIIADIIKGNPSLIISKYVTTPLTWGIHTGASNNLAHYSDIFDKQYAISRFGSGSHLMAIVDANTKGYTIDKDQFHIIKNLDGALESLGSLDTDVFYWEKYTTQPFVDSKQVKRIGEYITPWACFVIAASEKILKTQATAVISLLGVIHESCERFMMDANAITMISERYGIRIPDVERWYYSTEWATHGWIRDNMMKNVLYHLKTAGIIEENQEIPELIWRR